MNWYVICRCILRGHLSKRVSHSDSPPNCVPDINRGKAIAASSVGILAIGGLSALSIAVAAFVVGFFLCVFYGIGVALFSL